jgi:hypothetical protein
MDMRVRFPPEALPCGEMVSQETLDLFFLVRVQARQFWRGRPIGRVDRLKICVVWVRVPPALFKCTVSVKQTRTIGWPAVCLKKQSLRSNKRVSEGRRPHLIRLNGCKFLAVLNIADVTQW